MRPLSRRDFLRNSALGGAALSVGGSALLAACGSSGSIDELPRRDGRQQGRGLRSAAEAQPQEQPCDAAAVHRRASRTASSPRTGTLKIFNYADYVGPDVVKAFEKKYGVKVEVTDVRLDGRRGEQAPGQHREASTSPTSHPTASARSSRRSILQPLNHSYIPNFSNVWPSLQTPFYDKGSQYSIPYTLYTTGVGYRVDKIDPADDPFKLDDGTDLLYNPKYKGRTWVLDDDREALSMALLRLGITDVNTEDPELISKAGDGAQPAHRPRERQGRHPGLHQAARGPGVGAPGLGRRHDQRGVQPARRASSPTCSATGSSPTARASSRTT